MFGAPNTLDRAAALRSLAADEPSDELLGKLAALIEADDSAYPALPATPLTTLKKESLRPLFRKLLTNKSVARRADGVRGLGFLAPTTEDTATLRTLGLSETTPLSVLAVTIDALAKFAPKENVDVFQKAVKIGGRNGVARAAQAALAIANGTGGN